MLLPGKFSVLLVGLVAVGAKGDNVRVDHERCLFGRHRVGLAGIDGIAEIAIDEKEEALRLARSTQPQAHAFANHVGQLLVARKDETRVEIAVAHHLADHVGILHVEGVCAAAAGRLTVGGGGGEHDLVHDRPEACDN